MHPNLYMKHKIKYIITLILFIGFINFGSAQQINPMTSTDFSNNLKPKDDWIYKPIDGKAERYCNGQKCNGEIIDTLDNDKIIHKAFYVDGKPQGLATTFFSNGQVKSIGNYENGIKIGIWNYYFENGNIESEIIYNLNLKEPQKWIDYYENGMIESKFEYNNQGIPLYHYDFNEKGDTIYAYYPIDFEELIYEFYEHHSNGQLQEIGQQKYTENEGWIKIGIWKWFDENGILNKEINYEK